MMNRIKLFFVSLLILSSSSAWIAREDPFNELLKKLEEFAKKYPQEKVHLHLDKPYYAIGDDIWFKAYVTDTKTAALTTLSQILYVELIDEKDSLKQQLKLPLLNGIGWNDFRLPDSLSEGNYRIRAYTQLMRNAGPDFFFDKTIKIGNSWANKVFTKANYQFSKEGNREKINSTIKFNDSEGKPYTSSNVSYVVELGPKTISRSRATTNTNGEISIPIVNSQPNINKAGRITATITLADKKQITKVIPISATSSAVNVQFFPESGALLAGLPMKVALKVVNAQGKGEDVKGVILDGDGTELTSFETSHLGMGNFFLNPNASVMYKARIKFKDGSEKLFNLPNVANSGYALSVNNSDTTKVAVKVLLTNDLVGKGDLQLLAQQNGSVYYSIKIPTGKNFAMVYLPKSAMPSGINTLTLFNTASIPVAERLIFVNNEADKIDLTIDHLKDTYNKRDLVNLDFISMHMGKPIEGSFSVAVTNTTAVEPDLLKETNIFTSLLLTSDLKGYVENPNYYFLADDAKTRLALDNLLLTQGWRKIDWQAVSRSQFPATAYPVETELKISGTVTTNTGKPVRKGKVSLFSSSAGVFAVDTLTDAHGRFNFDQLTFPDSSKFVIQARNEKGKRGVLIKLDVVSGQSVTTNSNTGDIEINVNEQLKSYLQNSNDYFDEMTRRGFLSKTIQLKKVEIFGAKNKVKVSENLNGAGNADGVVTAADLARYFTLPMALSRHLIGIQIRNGNAYVMRQNKPMAIIMDGMYMQDLTLDKINITEIESIEMLKSLAFTTIYGSRGAYGVLVITTKFSAGTFMINNFAPGIITYAPKGFAANRQFYSPKYADSADPKPDLRTTVYWDPSILSDEKGNFKLEYFNTDEPGLYRVVIEGMDLMGNIARKTFTYQVN
jgi:TonB-dependent SusC/RagA subfamily outer membrane receptor